MSVSDRSFWVDADEVDPVLDQPSWFRFIAHETVPVVLYGGVEHAVTQVTSDRDFITRIMSLRLQLHPDVDLPGVPMRRLYREVSAPSPEPRPKRMSRKWGLNG